MNKGISDVMPTQKASKIVGIQFSILSPDEIRRGSVAEITSRDTYINNKRNYKYLLTIVNIDAYTINVINYSVNSNT